MDNLEALYQQVIMDHARERHGAGAFPEPHGSSFQVNPTCGDQATVQVRLEEGEGGPRLHIAWDGVGCSISQASLSLMHDLTDGGTLQHAEELGETFREMMRSRGDFPEERLDLLEDASALIGVSRYPARIKCALLGWMGLRAAAAEALATTDHNQKES
ncbi:MAG TPA: SUF system NifU family Fe-S cluster assembly protein [Actinomycetales bacterium]|nr:SUF system NifU family Fe-S cluster assembly protein [Actinomycetales bacterium]